MRILRKKISGIYRFPAGTEDRAIIDHILHDFSLKLFHLLEDYYDPKIGCSSLCTYEVFKQRWAIPDPGDVSHDGEEIYSEIPSSEVAKIIRTEFPGGSKYSEKDITGSFSGGEFPILTIWKGYHEGLNQIHVTFDISR